MNFTIETLGCKVNQYESQVMLERLEKEGFNYVSLPERADILIINSCTVTAVSDKKMRQLIHKAKRENPNSIVVLTGCMPQAFPQKALEFDDVDILLGNSNRDKIVEYLKTFEKNHEKIVSIKAHEDKKIFEKNQRVSKFEDRTRAFVKIEDGCNRFCSYCIIPYARGRVRSKRLSELREELLTLSQNDYKEIVLTGINLCAYGSDLGINLYDAVKVACDTKGIERVRLGSLEPYYLTPEVINKLSKLPQFCPQFHISLQSGCDATLLRMNRHYTSSDYMKIVCNIRGSFENPSITTDVMVGFAGETNEEFNESKSFVESVGFAKVHVFPYSRRPQTKAYDFNNHVSKSVKLDRAKEMRDTAKKLRTKFLISQIGRNEKVLFETKDNNGLYEGYTKNYTPVRVKSDKDITGKICEVVLDGENIIGI